MEDNTKMQDVEIGVGDNDEMKGSEKAQLAEDHGNVGKEEDVREDIQEEEGKHMEEEHMESDQVEREDVKGEHLKEEHMEEKLVEEEYVEREHVEREHVEGEHLVGEHLEGEHVEGEYVEGEHVAVEHVEGEQMEEDHVEGDHVKGEHVEGEIIEGEHVECVEEEHVEGEHVEGEHVDGEHIDGEHLDGKPMAEEHIDGEYVEIEDIKPEDGERLLGESEEVVDETMKGEQLEDEQIKGGSKEEIPLKEAVVEEEEAYVEPPPPDPAAPLDFSDSKEALREPFELSPDQMIEVEKLWDFFQNYTPVYTDIDGYITEKELVYMLKSLLVMTYTLEQLKELIDFCVRPRHPEGHITFDQFVKMVTIRQRDFPIEEELRCALEALDPNKTGLINREFFKEVLFTQGYQMPQKHLDNLLKEVDISNDGTLAIEDVLGTMCIDLNKEDIVMLKAAILSRKEKRPVEDFF